MPKEPGPHPVWRVGPEDGASWQTIATKLGVTKAALLAANGYTTASHVLVVGEVLQLPLGL